MSIIITLVFASTWYLNKMPRLRAVILGYGAMIAGTVSIEVFWPLVLLGTWTVFKFYEEQRV